MAIQLRRTGSTGLKGISGSPGSTEWFAGIGFALAIAVGVAAPVLDPRRASSTRSRRSTRDALNYAGVALALVGVFLTFTAQMAMGDSWRVGVDTR